VWIWRWRRGRRWPWWVRPACPARRFPGCAVPSWGSGARSASGCPSPACTATWWWPSGGPPGYAGSKLDHPDRVLDLVGLSGRGRERPEELAPGARQRAGLAVGVAAGPGASARGRADLTTRHPRPLPGALCMRGVRCLGEQGAAAVHCFGTRVCMRTLEKTLHPQWTHSESTVPHPTCPMRSRRCVMAVSAKAIRPAASEWGRPPWRTPLNTDQGGSTSLVDDGLRGACRRRHRMRVISGGPRYGRSHPNSSTCLEHLSSWPDPAVRTREPVSDGGRADDRWHLTGQPRSWPTYRLAHVVRAERAAVRLDLATETLQHSPRNTHPG
jgi:hypothetical protein